ILNFSENYDMLLQRDLHLRAFPDRRLRQEAHPRLRNIHNGRRHALKASLQDLDLDRIVGLITGLLPLLATLPPFGEERLQLGKADRCRALWLRGHLAYCLSSRSVKVFRPVGTAVLCASAGPLLRWNDVGR